MFPTNDNSYNESVLKDFSEEKDGYTITSSEGWSFYLPNKNVQPKIGQTIRCYGHGFGSVVRGMFLDGQKVFYRTVEEQEELHAQHSREIQAKKEQEFAQNKDEMDRQFAALPAVFQRRVQFFRDHCPKNFRVEFERYELFVCSQAVLFAEKFKTVDGIRAFAKASYESQREMLPELDDNHSGNTMGCAITLALHYVNNPENVFYEHGAMVPLVGCVEYGCLHGEQYGR